MKIIKDVLKDVKKNIIEIALFNVILILLLFIIVPWYSSFQTLVTQNKIYLQLPRVYYFDSYLDNSLPIDYLGKFVENTAYTQNSFSYLDGIYVSETYPNARVLFFLGNANLLYNFTKDYGVYVTNDLNDISLNDNIVIDDKNFKVNYIIENEYFFNRSYLNKLENTVIIYMSFEEFYNTFYEDSMSFYGLSEVIMFDMYTKEMGLDNFFNSIGKNYFKEKDFKANIMVGNSRLYEGLLFYSPILLSAIILLVLINMYSINNLINKNKVSYSINIIYGSNKIYIFFRTYIYLLLTFTIPIIALFNHYYSYSSKLSVYIYTIIFVLFLIFLISANFIRILNKSELADLIRGE